MFGGLEGYLYCCNVDQYHLSSPCGLDTRWLAVRRLGNCGNSGMLASKGHCSFTGIPKISTIFCIWFLWKGTDFLLSIFASSPLKIGRRERSSAKIQPIAQRSTAGV